MLASWLPPRRGLADAAADLRALFPSPLSLRRVAALNSEQKALVDFLVLAKARRFVGFGSSTFSFYLREYRALQVRGPSGRHSGSQLPLLPLLLLCCPCRRLLTVSSPVCLTFTQSLQGIPREMSGLVDASIIGTDKLFHSAGTVV